MFMNDGAIDLQQITVKSNEGLIKRKFEVGEKDKKTNKVCTAIKVSRPLPFEPSKVAIYLDDSLHAIY